MTDYLNPHHVYIDAQAAPDLGVEVKRDEKEIQKMTDTTANIVPETVGTPHNPARIDRRKHINLISPGMEAARNEPPETDAEHIIRLYRSGMSHVDIAGRGFDLAEVRRVISEATRADEKLYQAHKEGR